MEKLWWLIGLEILEKNMILTQTLQDKFEVCSLTLLMNTSNRDACQKKPLVVLFGNHAKCFACVEHVSGVLRRCSEACVILHVSVGRCNAKRQFRD